MTGPLGVEVRIGRQEDLDAIGVLMSRHELWQHYGVEAHAAARRLSRLVKRGDWLLVAEMLGDTEPVPAGFVLFSERTFGDHGYIHFLGVRPDMTGHGLGAHLLEEAERTLSEHGVRSVFLLCTRWNRPAQRFYRRHGYRRVGTLPSWIQAGTDEIIMVKPRLPEYFPPMGL